LFSGSGVRIKILEAMALGKTVITTSIGAEGIMCQHQKNILLADTPAEFLNAISNCYTEPGMAEQIGVNARKYIQEYHLIEKVSSITKNFYQQLIQNLN
jgi:glycosyltransferase involved in cell wall biosynthesis